MIMLFILLLLVLAFAVACTVIPSWRPFIAFEDTETGALTILGSKHAYAIRSAQHAARRKQPARTPVLCDCRDPRCDV